MFAIGHAATALLIKRAYPEVSLTPILISVQAMEFAWVGLNFLGIEHLSTESTVRSVADIHLEFMPYSHSVLLPVAVAVAVWLCCELRLSRPSLGRAVGIGIVSHLVLDLGMHARDIALWPGAGSPKFGLGLYDTAPMVAFIVELVYGVLCWRVHRGSRVFAALIVAASLSNLTFFSSAIPGPEILLAGHPLWIVSLVLVQIVLMLGLVKHWAEPKARG